MKEIWISSWNDTTSGIWAYSTEQKAKDDVARIRAFHPYANYEIYMVPVDEQD